MSPGALSPSVRSCPLLPALALRLHDSPRRESASSNEQVLQVLFLTRVSKTWT